MKFLSNKKSLSFIAAMVMTVSTFSFSFATADFKDLKEVSWAKETIQRWADLELVGGYEDGTFRPQNSITRAEFAKIVVEAYEMESPGKASFQDVNPNDWFADYVRVLASNGFVTGYGDNTFKPNNPITRGEAAVVLSRVERLVGNEEAARAFEDFEAIPSWARAQVGAASEAGIINGMPNGNFAPLANITRAETIVMFDRALYGENVFAKDWKLNKAGTYGNGEVIAGNVYIQSEDVVLENVTVEGNLVFGREILDGDATIENVTVLGETQVFGGGENSLYIRNSRLNRLVSARRNRPVRIAFQGNTTVDNIVAKGQSNFDGSDLSTEGSLGTLIIEEGTQGEVKLNGNFDKVVVNAKDIVITLSEKTVIREIEVNVQVEVRGKGTIVKATVNVENVKFETKPGQTVTPSTPAPTPPASGGSTGGGGGSTTPITKSYKLSLTIGDETIVLGEKLSINPSTKLSLGVLQEALEDNTSLATNEKVLKMINSALDKEYTETETYAQAFVRKLEEYDGELPVLNSFIEVKDAKGLASQLAETELADLNVELLKVFGAEKVSELPFELEIKINGDKVEGTTLSQLNTNAETALKNLSYADAAKKETIRVTIGSYTIVLNVVER